MSAYPDNRKMYVILEQEVYYPGQTINGRVVCNFTEETIARAIRVRFDGAAIVAFSRGKQRYGASEKYLELEANILIRKTIILPGKHAYPFTFDLPSTVPPSVKRRDGNIKYTVQATIDRPWALDYTDEREFKVATYTDLNYLDDVVKGPQDFTSTKEPTSFSDTGLITLNVQVPRTCYVPTQMITFTARIKNESNIDVQSVRFNMTQIFTFSTASKKEIDHEVVGQEFAVIDSLVKPGNEKLWNLQLRVPADAYKENLSVCKHMKYEFQLIGEVVVPFPHLNFGVNIPIVLGDVPLIT